MIFCPACSLNWLCVSCLHTNCSSCAFLALDVSSFEPDEVGSAEHRAPNISEPQSSPVSGADTEDLNSASPNFTTQPEPPVTDSVAACEIPPPATQTELLCTSTDGDGNPKIVPITGLCPGRSTEASDIDLGLIPPPSDFMDEPRPPARPEEVKHHPPYAGISSNKPGATIDLEQLRQRASVKRTSVGSSKIQETPNMTPPEVFLARSPPAVYSGHQMSPPPEAAEPRSPPAEPRSPPAVAPKPKKLPANIILKSHKASVAGSDSSSGHSVPSSGDRLLLDPQRVRFEALRKLGLLKSDESDSGPALSPKHSPKTRRSWGAPPSPISPTAPHTPLSTPSNSPLPASFPPQSPAAVSSSAPNILPAPAAFCDPSGPLPSDNELPAVKEVSGANVNALVNSPPITPSGLAKHLTPPKIIGVKSATLERSGLGLSSYMASQDSDVASQGVGSKLSPSQLRNSRPRPASLGSGKEFSGAQGAGLQAGRATSQDPDSRRSLPAHIALQHSGDSQKLPRSQGISVLICPRAENGGNRREALKKLGLLRD